MYQHVDGSKQTTSALIYQPVNGKGKCCCQNLERNGDDALALRAARVESSCNNKTYLQHLRMEEAETEFLDEEESDPANHNYALSDFDL